MKCDGCGQDRQCIQMTDPVLKDDGHSRSVMFCLACSTNVVEAAKFRAGEQVNHPAHYGGDTVYEVIKVLEAWDVQDVYVWQALKYLARAGKKGDLLEDLKKAAWYLDRRIKKLEAK